jgi:sigma-B regulation protein RsbU (phosphoserine phosphatase)
MTASTTPRILVCADQMTALAELRRQLTTGGWDVDGHLLGTPDPDAGNAYRLVVVEEAASGSVGLEFCRRLRRRVDEDVAPVLYIMGDHAPAARLAAFEGGAHAYLLRPFAPGELIAQVRSFLRIHEAHDRSTELTAELHRVNRLLQQAYHQIDQDLELAQRIQSTFLPQTLPEAPGAEFAVRHWPSGRVGGDFYDVFRLDETHVGFYIADAMGHGVSASLLTLFVKKGLRSKELSGRVYRLPPPDEVVGRLNKDLIDQDLSENPFLTMVYCLFNSETRTVQLARAGHPYPLLIPKDGPLELWRQEGLLLGVVDAKFPATTHTLRPGDKLLLYSDGVDSARFEGGQPGTESLLGCAERHRALSVHAFVDRLARELFSSGEHPDDLTLLALEMSK